MYRLMYNRKNETREFEFDNKKCKLRVSVPDLQYYVVNTSNDAIVVSEFGVDEKQLKKLAKAFLVSNGILQKKGRRPRKLKGDV